MSKKFLGALLCLGVIVVVYFSTSLPITAPSPTPSPGSTSLEEKICAKVSVHYGDCKRIILIDTNSNLAFAESKLGILPVLYQQRPYRHSKDDSSIIVFPRVQKRRKRREGQ